MRTEKWVQCYFKKDGKTLSQIHLEDGSWVCYSRGLYDSRDIMSDCAKPSWDSSGEYEIKIMNPETNDSYFADFVVYCNKDWGNKIAYNINSGVFKTVEELKSALRKLGNKAGTYTQVCRCESIRLEA